MSKPIPPSHAPQPGDDDPDALGLPPGTQLPERTAFMRGQLRAVAVSNGVALVALALLLLILPQHRTVVLVCIAAVALMFLLALVRWVRALRE